MRFALLIAVAWALTGCGCGASNEGNGSLKGRGQTSLDALNRAATEYGGDWDKVPPEDRKLILIRFDNDEEAAIATLKSMSEGRSTVGGTNVPPAPKPKDAPPEGTQPAGGPGLTN